MRWNKIKPLWAPKGAYAPVPPGALPNRVKRNGLCGEADRRAFFMGCRTGNLDFSGSFPWPHTITPWFRGIYKKIATHPSHVHFTHLATHLCHPCPTGQKRSRMDLVHQAWSALRVQLEELKEPPSSPVWSARWGRGLGSSRIHLHQWRLGKSG